jgi:hypothetical protein
MEIPDINITRLKGGKIKNKIQTAGTIILLVCMLYSTKEK